MTYKDIIREEIVERYGNDITEDLMYYLKHTYFNDDQYEYADNLRIAKVGNEDEVKKYIDQLYNGCCGSYDEMKLIDHDIFLIGFNYGH